MAEKKYIECEAAKKAACEGCNAEFGEDPCEPCDCSLMVAIDAIPAADVVERKTGVWLMDKMTRTCSVCGQMKATRQKDNYCPNCGAQMIGGDDDGT